MILTSQRGRPCRRFKPRPILGSTTVSQRALRARSDSARAEPGKGESRRLAPARSAGATDRWGARRRPLRLGSPPPIAPRPDAPYILRAPGRGKRSAFGSPPGLGQRDPRRRRAAHSLERHRLVRVSAGSATNPGGFDGEKIIRVSDQSGNEIPDGKGATVRITFADARKGVRELDLTDSEADALGGRAVARRGRRPKPT
jgi:hypothetical protein